MGSTYKTIKSTSKNTSSTQSGGTSKTYASGKVSDNTQKNMQKYNNGYQQSDVVNQAYQKLQGLNKPGEFTSQYESQMNELYDKFVNREDFNFDVNESALYEQLRDQYAALGKLAMKDTMGQAAGMTGGYGNSYAQTAGQQSYQNYMQQLQEQIPSLYQMELERYNQEGENMLNEYNLAKNLYDTEYGEHRDAMSDYYTDRDYYNQLYQDERNFDYNKYQADRDYWTDQYWNEKNAATTTESSNWSNTTSETTQADDVEIPEIQTKYYSGDIAENVGGFGYMGKDNNGKPYQPKGVYVMHNGQVVPMELKKSGYTVKDIYGSGRTNTSGVNVEDQNIWEAGGYLFVWNGTINEYERLGRKQDILGDK